jgi:hypothetical protein
MAANDTTPEIVMLKNLRGSTKPGGNGMYEIRIPVFQRGIVWNDSQKKKLIESIKLGYPVGSLMAYQTFEERANGEHKPVWSLIDGLQRTSTIIEYLDKPFKIADPSLFYTPEHLGEISSILFPEDPVSRISDLTNELNAWLSAIGTNDAESGFHAGKLQQHLVEKLFDNVHLNAEKSLQLINYLPEKFFAHINREIGKIEDATLPFIVYRGHEDQVPEIFERINTQGMKLSKYETFAATWTYKKVEIDSDDIKEKIRRKYAALEEQGYVISGISGDSRDLNDFNLFEYLFGLGKVLTEKHPLIFRASEDDSDPVPLSFVLATVSFKLPISKMKELAAKLGEVYAGNSINLSAFENALRISCSEVEESLRGFLKIKLNSRSREKQFIPHSDNQIFSYIARYLIERFDPDNNWSERQGSRASELLKNIPKFYVLDILNGTWSGSGDSRLFRMTWTGGDASGVPSGDYLNPPQIEEWDTTLESWHNRELSKLQKERSGNTVEAKLLLKFLYQDVMTVVQNETWTFDIEHLWSVEKLKNLVISTNSDGWPIGAFSNLALLEKDINQTKGSVMLGDYQKSPESADLQSHTWEQIQKLVIWPPIASLTFEKSLTKETYLDFCKTRFSELKKILLKEVGFSLEVQQEYYQRMRSAI